MGNLSGYSCILVLSTSAGLVAKDAATPAAKPQQKCTTLAVPALPDCSHSVQQHYMLACRITRGNYVCPIPDSLFLSHEVGMPSRLVTYALNWTLFRTTTGQILTFRHVLFSLSIEHQVKSRERRVSGQCWAESTRQPTDTFSLVYGFQSAAQTSVFVDTGFISVRKLEKLEISIHNPIADKIN